MGRIVLRLGAFHLACSFLGIIGKRFRDASLEDILIESDVIAAGSVSGVLERKHYNRGIRMHKLVMEALFYIKWKKFGQWLTEQENPPAYTSLQDDIKNIQQDVTRASYDRIMNNKEYYSLLMKFNEFTLIPNDSVTLNCLSCPNKQFSDGKG